MSEKVKGGFIGGLIGALVAFGTIMVTTGKYTHKIESNTATAKENREDIDKLEDRTTGLEHDVAGATVLLKEVRDDVKTLLRKEG